MRKMHDLLTGTPKQPEETEVGCKAKVMNIPATD
jgi:hypothetical protein